MEASSSALQCLTAMWISQDSAIAADPASFDRAWDDSPSVAIVPDKLSDSAWVHQRLKLIEEELREDHFVLLTSGSSGRPKLVIGKKSRAEALARLLHSEQNNAPAERALIVLPLSYSFAFVNQWIWAKVHQKVRHVSPGFKRPDQLRSDLSAKTPQMLCLVGAQVPLLLRHFGGSSFSEVTNLHFAGGPFPQSRLPELQSMFPRASITNNYGCTEAMPRLTLRRAEESDNPANVGRSLPGIELQCDAQGNVVFRSPYGAVGHIDDTGLHRYPSDAWLAAGDLGEINHEGELLVRGRRGSVFKRYGEKISLENLLQTTQKVWPGHAAFYLDQDPSGEPGHVLVIDEPEDAPGFRKILKAMREGFPRTHWPIRIERLLEFPTLPNGKPDLSSLKEIKKDQILWRQRL